MLVMQEDPDGEHQENVLATGMVASSRPRYSMTKTTRPPNGGGTTRFSVHRALRVSARKKRGHQRRRGRSSSPTSVPTNLRSALSGSKPKAPGSAGGYLPN